MFSMKVEGGAEFAKAIRELSPSRERGLLNKMLLKAAEPIRSRAEELAPVEAGKPDLRDNILAKAVSDKEIADPEAMGKRLREDTESVVAVGPAKDSFYGFFQEYGTAKHGAQPFMRPAFDEKGPQALTIFQQDIWAWLRQRSERAGASTTGRNL